ncbi:hypothetical protein [Rathayibacter sp. AY1E3]|nr:hypothetical protein [Rathayibacter sp. AY1E3]
MDFQQPCPFNHAVNLLSPIRRIAQGVAYRVSSTSGPLVVA